MNGYKLSIIVPCYNVEKYLPRCMDTLVHQTLEDIEIICVNDGSPDNCISILKEYRNKYGEKIKIIDKKNGGVWAGRQDGIKLAQGEYIGFIDADDYVSLDFAQKMYNAAVKERADVLCCGYQRIDMCSGKVYSREMTKFPYKKFNLEKNPGLLLEINAAPWNKIYKAHLLKNMYELKSIPKVFEDMIFLQLVYIKARKIAIINEALIYYMVRKESAINSFDVSLIPGIYGAISEIKTLYCKEKPQMIQYLNAVAFLHLGVSLMYRVYELRDGSFERVFKNNIEFMNANFQGWNKNDYIRLKYTCNNRGANAKILLMNWLYKVHCFKLFLCGYVFMINKMHIDIKW